MKVVERSSISRYSQVQWYHNINIIVFRYKDIIIIFATKCRRRSLNPERSHVLNVWKNACMFVRVELYEVPSFVYETFLSLRCLYFRTTFRTLLCLLVCYASFRLIQMLRITLSNTSACSVNFLNSTSCLAM